MNTHTHITFVVCAKVFQLMLMSHQCVFFCPIHMNLLFLTQLSGYFLPLSCIRLRTFWSTFYQCCGSGSARIRNPHWFDSPGSGSVLGMRFREQGNWPKFTHKPGSSLSRRLYITYLGMLMTYYLHKVYFSGKTSTFSDGKVWPGSA